MSSPFVYHLRAHALPFTATNSWPRRLQLYFCIIDRSALAPLVSPPPITFTLIRTPSRKSTALRLRHRNNSFHTAGWRTVVPEETPAAELNVPGTNAAVRHHPHRKEVQNGDEIRSAGKDAANQSHNAAYEVKVPPMGVAQKRLTRLPIGDDNVHPETMRQGLKSRLQGFKEQEHRLSEGPPGLQGSA
ncbi:hypothetical protein FA95DRAFT_1611829 [Auriscalpium vulgare]|uniref:Uncharacterized protein n=1 Tax=Auriscalpium vulgare TaxID=40419 RepID=A0ACB8R910_9AGAM|nr:hypothetical protein FA95DRAFT_1611829 [Auriscalpium vulgare]